MKSETKEKATASVGAELRSDVPEGTCKIYTLSVPSDREKRKTQCGIFYGNPYSVINDCLYIERIIKDTTIQQKLCNFAPYLLRETTYHDGADTEKKLCIGGVHESGRDLPALCIPATDFVAMQWIGVRCNMETGQAVKDFIRHAIQCTAAGIRNTDVFAHTGWVQQNQEWHYLFAGHPSISVELQGKLQNYRLRPDCADHDLAAVFSLLECKLAPPQILYPLLSMVFLSPLNEFLRQAGCEPKTVLTLIGKTGARKSTLAALILCFFGSFTNTDLPLSFRDTTKSIQHHIFTLKHVLTVIDDFHPGGRFDEQDMTKSAQMIMRAYGDRVGRNKLRFDSSPMHARSPRGNTILTAEFPPDITESGTARYLQVELAQADIDLEQLTYFQSQTSHGAFSGVMFRYTQWLKTSFLSGDAQCKAFVAGLGQQFSTLRRDFAGMLHRMNAPCHPRIPEAVAWLQIGFDWMLEFFQSTALFNAERKEEFHQHTQDILIQLAKAQADSVLHDKLTEKFLCKLFSLVDCGEVSILCKNDPAPYTNGNLAYY